MYKSLLKSSVKDVDQKGRVVVAANAFGNLDSDGDVSMSGSFDASLKEDFDRLRWFRNHNQNENIGVPIEGKEQDGVLRMVGQINLKKQLGQDIYADYLLFAEYGKSLEHSVGVTPIDFKDDGGVRRVFKWKYWEFSTLSAWGANPKTPMLAIKNNNPIEAIDWLETILQKGKFTDEKFMAIEGELITLKSLLETDQTTQNDEALIITDLDDISTTILKSLQTT